MPAIRGGREPLPLSMPRWNASHAQQKRGGGLA
jgi:hypothetical protein